MKNLLKNTFPHGEKLFSQPGISDKWNKNCFSQVTKPVSTWKLFFFSIFQRNLPVSFSPSSWKVSLTKSFIPAIGNGCSGYWKPSSFFQNFFLVLEAVTEIKGQFSQKGHVLTNVTDFLTSGNHFPPFFSDSGQLMPVEAVFPATGTYFSVNFSFRPAKRSLLSTGHSIALFQVFFC